ncbi:hypothetical protein DSO57_1027630 [Entomophthora muscae]|uniref:Uncharacterized protein n=1 Tax=Entomophthora muscae TaxID=34485 RepID=A0ACC2T1R6_9FUNG|nr:hypothetical protein DSO57_1027630 [Entomophthora muscae]
MKPFLNPEALFFGKCTLCSKKPSIFNRHCCQLCDNIFCNQCCFSSPLLPKKNDVLFSSNKACSICALAWLIPALEAVQIIKLPTKLIVSLCKAYNIEIYASSEKTELIQELKKRNPIYLGLPSTYKVNWQQISLKLKDSRNLLPQIENSLINGRSQREFEEGLRQPYQPDTQTYPSRANPNASSGARTRDSIPTRHENPASTFSSTEPVEAPQNSSRTCYASHTPAPESTNIPEFFSSSSRSTQAHGSHSTNSRPVVDSNASVLKHPKVFSLKELLLEEDYEDKAKNLPVSSLKSILRENCISFDGVIEKAPLVQKVVALVASIKDDEKAKTSHDSILLEEHKLNSGFEDEDNLCKICFEQPANCVLLECGHSISCVECGKELMRLNQPCPICRTDIIRVVRIFR